MAELHNRILGAVLHTPEVVPHTLEAALRIRAVAPGVPLPEVAAKMLPGAVVAATLTGNICMISLSMRPSTSIRKEILTMGSSVPTISVTLSSDPRSIRFTLGGVISIFLLNMVDRDVATVPII